MHQFDTPLYNPAVLISCLEMDCMRMSSALCLR